MRDSLPIEIGSHPSDPRRDALLVFARAATSERLLHRMPVCLTPLFRPAVGREAPSDRYAVHLFGQWSGAVEPVGWQVHPQVGTGFKARLNSAVQTMVAAGYERIVIVGGDCPDLCRADIEQAFHQLRRHDAVVGPDHRGGSYLIGLHAADAALLERVVWQRNTDHAQLCELYAGRPIARLAAKIDVDDWADLRELAESGGACSGLLRALFAWFSRHFRPKFHVWVDLAAAAERTRRMTSPPGPSAALA